MYYTIKGLVLNSKIQGEYDKLITVYSYEWGKIRAVAPSAKKITAKLSAATEPLTESEFMVFNNNSSRLKVTGARILKNNTTIKTNFERSIYALYAAEIGDKFAPFNLANTIKYDLILRIWEILAVCRYPKRALMAFILRFLKQSGYSFVDYLKNNNAFVVDSNIEKTIKTLSNCPGNNVDLLDIVEDDKVWTYVEIYLTNYIRRPSVGIFLTKISGM